MFQIALASRVKNWDEMQQIGDVFVASVSTFIIILLQVIVSYFTADFVNIFMGALIMLLINYVSTLACY